MAILLSEEGKKVILTPSLKEGGNSLNSLSEFSEFSELSEFSAFSY